MKESYSELFLSNNFQGRKFFRTIRSLEDLLRACILKLQGVSWSECLPLIEFTYTNNFHSSFEMTPFEVLYGKRSRTPLCWYES